MNCYISPYDWSLLKKIFNPAIDKYLLDKCHVTQQKALQQIKMDEKLTLSENSFDYYFCNFASPELKTLISVAVPLVNMCLKMSILSSVSVWCLRMSWNSMTNLLKMQGLYAINHNYYFII